ncbi:MAG TPA: phosphatase PAP2 family protein [Chloroflexia bacterium]|nr:phosphatase PAP2 family protein [Chloroflexia bacterium]
MLNQAQLETGNALDSNGYLRRKLARIVTNVTAPPLLAIPSFIGLGLYDQAHRPGNYNLGLSLGLALFFGSILPILSVVMLLLTGLVSDVHIGTRRQRTLPYSLTLASFACGAVFLWLETGLCLLTALLICYAVNSLIMMLINLNWKISVHASGLGGQIAVFTLVVGWAALPLYALAVLVSWARIYLRAHTPGQVAAGSALGFSLTLAQLILLRQPS